MPDHPQLTVRSRLEWRSWLEANHERAAGIWLVRFKKGFGPYVSYEEAVEEAIAFGWVDSKSRTLDDRRSQLLLTPRRPRSRWSSSNRERVVRLREQGLMSPAGEAAVCRAQADGSWDAQSK
jgi:uncharacterized protein YdeI (YjbR/CyaY-like superfamily)